VELLYSLDIAGKNVVLKNIEKESIPHLAGLLNSVPDSVYATGIELPVTHDMLNQKYAEAVLGKEEIFSGIYPAGEEQLAGIIRASIREDDGNVLWINSIIVFPPFRRIGLGSKAVELLIDNVSKKRSIQKACLTVLAENTTGRAFWSRNGFSETRRIRRKNKEGREQLLLIMSKVIVPTNN
jgi:ribosomal protein S18 acetylase RimI-like enzyme